MHGNRSQTTPQHQQYQRINGDLLGDGEDLWLCWRVIYRPIRWIYFGIATRRHGDYRRCYIHWGIAFFLWCVDDSPFDGQQLKLSYLSVQLRHKEWERQPKHIVVVGITKTILFESDVSVGSSALLVVVHHLFPSIKSWALNPLRSANVIVVAVVLAMATVCGVDECMRLAQCQMVVSSRMRGANYNLIAHIDIESFWTHFISDALDTLDDDWVGICNCTWNGGLKWNADNLDTFTILERGIGSIGIGVSFL